MANHFASMAGGDGEHVFGGDGRDGNSDGRLTMPRARGCAWVTVIGVSVYSRRVLEMFWIFGLLVFRAWNMSVSVSVPTSICAVSTNRTAYKRSSHV